MNAKDLIEVLDIDRRWSAYRIMRRMTGADYYIPTVSGPAGYKLRPVVRMKVGETPCWSINTIRILRDHALVRRLLHSICWSDYVSPTSGNQKHLYPKDIYAAVDDALVRQQCEQWREREEERSLGGESVGTGRGVQRMIEQTALADGGR